MPIKNKSACKSLPLAASLLVFGTLTAGCGADSADVAPETAQTVSEAGQPAEPAAGTAAQTSADPAASSEQSETDGKAKDIVSLDDSDYIVENLKPGQADLLNALIAAQNAGDPKAYAALFASRAPEEAKRIPFKIQTIQLLGRSEGEGPERIGAEFQKPGSQESFSIVYELTREAGEWRIKSAKTADGPYVDESDYEGDALEIVKLINSSIKYRNEGNAAAYKKLFGKGANMNELRPDTPIVKEMQIADVHYSEADGASIVYPMIKRAGDTDIWMPGYALLKKDGRWSIYDID